MWPLPVNKPSDDDECENDMNDLMIAIFLQFYSFCEIFLSKFCCDENATVGGGLRLLARQWRSREHESPIASNGNDAVAICLSPVDGNQTKFSKNPFCILNTIYARHSNYLSAARMGILIVDQAQQQPYSHAECMGIIVFGRMPSTGPPKIATQRQYSSEHSRFLPFGNDSFYG